jgi:glycosidase
MAQAEGVVANAAKGQSISKYTGYVASYQDKVLEKNPNGMIMPFLSNHDMDRIAGAFITENHMRMAANLYLLSPGSPVIYYGEELGMRGSRGGESTDANRRLAMLWGDDDLIRDPVGSTYPADKQIPTTAATQMADETSLYNYYCKLISLRHKYPAIARGDYTAVNIEKNLGGFVIRLGDETLLLLHNTSMEELTLDLSALTGTDGFIPDGILDFVGVGTAKLEGSILTVGPQTSVVLG